MVENTGHLMAYLDVRAKKYIEAWPNIPTVFQPVAERMLKCGIISSYITEGDTHSSVLTPIGEHFVFQYQQPSISYPLITVRLVLSYWPLSKLMNRDPMATNYLELLFKMSWNDVEVRSYISNRTEEDAVPRLRPDTEHNISHMLAGEHPALKHLLDFDYPGESEDFDFSDDNPAGVLQQIAESTGLDVDTPAFDALRDYLEEPASSTPAIEAPQPAAADNCEYCEGTRIDPFEGGPCPQCSKGRMPQFTPPDEPSEEDWDIL